jgi:hypothetical protein
LGAHRLEENIHPVRIAERLEEDVLVAAAGDQPLDGLVRPQQEPVEGGSIPTMNTGMARPAGRE